MNIQRNDGRNVTERLPERYRLIDKNGKAYSPFRLKPGVKLHEITSHAFPGHNDGWEVEMVRNA